MEPLAIYIKKLNHPIKEIRERSLKLLLTKLQCGWEIHDVLGSTRELIENLVAWLAVDQPPSQKDVLKLLLLTIKTEGGAYVLKEFGIKKLFTNINKLKNKIDQDAIGELQEIMETLNFLCTVDSEISLGIPPLILHSVASSSPSESICNIHKSFEPATHDMDANVMECIDTSAIRCLLFPWVDLSPSDTKTINLIRDSLKVLKSTRRCCRFIRDVFVRDFPVQIFLNRPAIIKTLLAISGGQCGAHPEEALCVLLCITHSLRTQLLQLFNLDLICQSQKISEKEEADDDVNIELEKTIEYNQDMEPQDTLLALRQLPVPIFALDTLQAIFTIMARRSSHNPDDTDIENCGMKETNTCILLVESLVKLLLYSVREKFWKTEHGSKTYRDIAHKTCIVMRLLGDLLMKYRKLFEDNPERVYYRMVWLRLVPCGGQLLHWARNSPLPPATLVTALQQAQIDPVLDLLYPTISTQISNVLLVAKSSVDKEHKSKYKELSKLYSNIDQAMKFKILKLSSRNIEKLLECIQKTLPIFHFHSDKNFFKEVVTILFEKAMELDPNDKNWSVICDIVLKLMAHKIDWVKVTFYAMLIERVRSAFVSDESKQVENEKNLNLLCHVEVLTEICCQGLSSDIEEVSACAAKTLTLVLRGRLAVSAQRWWRLLAALQPVFPLLHVYAAHDTALGMAICKSLDAEIASCMGVSEAERRAGLARVLFVRCGAVRTDAAKDLCLLLDDKKYLPPKESLRVDVLLNALSRLEPHGFNIEESSSSGTSEQTTGLIQILEVLKQDLTLEGDGMYTAKENATKATLEPSLRRSTLQQLAVMMRHQEMHETFVQNDGLNLVISLLRLSLMVDDYLAFPECAISCVSILNSVGFESRHVLANVKDLPVFLLRVMLVFPAHESCVSLAAQTLALCVWAGFLLHERDATGRRTPAVPQCVVSRACLPFTVLSYWNTSPNTEHSRIEWLLSDNSWRNAITFRWWWVGEGGAASVRAGFVDVDGHFTPGGGASASTASGAINASAATAIASCLTAISTKILLALENATSHQQAIQALLLLESCLPLARVSCTPELCALPWQRAGRFLRAPPASARDMELLAAQLHCILTYITYMPNKENAMSWIISSFIGNDAAVLSLLSGDRVYPQQSSQEEVELMQLRILIVRVMASCIVMVDEDGDYSSGKMESLIKILLASLEIIDLKNFHMLGYLNEVMRCIRYAVYSRYCTLSEDALVLGLRAMTRTLSGCASGSGRKGHACRLDATLATLALVRHAHEQAVPVQRWSEWFCVSTMRVLLNDCGASRTELRAASLHTVAALAHHAQLLPHILQCLKGVSLLEFAVETFRRDGEANVVRAAAASVITTVVAKTSPQSQISENEVLQTIVETGFIEECLNILIDFCKEKDYNELIEPNVPMSVLEREPELSVRAEKCEIRFSPTSVYHKPPPTANLVAAVADAIHNLSTYKKTDVKTWNDQGIYRMLFRCASWLSSNSGDRCRVRAASCRALVAGATHRCVRVALAHTLDCLHEFIRTLTNTTETPVDYDMGISARTHSLYLLSTLLQDHTARDVIWTDLKKEQSELFFKMILESLNSENKELQEAAIYLLTILTSSMINKTQKDASKDDDVIEFFDNVKSAGEVITDRLSAGDSEGFDDCQPEYMAESYCKVIMKLFHECSDRNICYSSQDKRWRRISACLACLVRASMRARRYGAHRQLPRALTVALQRIRDALSLQGKSADCIRNSNNEPILETLHGLLLVTSCLTADCRVVKEALCEERVETSLTRLWAWCMMTDALRTALLEFLLNLTNDCPKAWARMCVCVSGRSLAGEACALAAREAVRMRSPALLPLALRLLTNCAPHNHCRTIMVKSEVVSCAVRCTSRGSAEAAALCAALARHADGAAALLGALSAAPPRRLLPALAHAAHHQRQLCLHSTDILQLLANALLAGNVEEAVSAARAVWALAANNHRAKLILRSSGIVSALQSAIHRLQRLEQAGGEAERALQLLNYTHTVLQAT